ncbi:MAG: kelch repeat-containing protein [Solirubrobacteraceae bacterium]|nr:kelch repeat-containing protein [Patulibacter sp.]
MRLRSIRARRVRTACVLAVLGLAVFAAEAEATVAPAGSMATDRYGATAAPVVDAAGNVTGVVVAGGIDSTNGLLGSAEFYDAATRSWSPAGTLATPRSGAKAVTLPVTAARPQGGVLVEGGLNINGARIADTEIYDRATNSWSDGGALTDARTGEALVRVGADVLVIGGVVALPGGGTTTTATVERRVDGRRAAWAATGSLSAFRSNVAATEIYGGRVLAAGGDDSKGNPVTTAQVYDATSEAWSPDTAPLATARAGSTATAIGGGAQVLVAGGIGAAGRLRSAELYTVATNAWSSAGSMAVARNAATAVAINPGLVEVVGGVDGRVQAQDAESWSSTDGWAGPGGPGTSEPLDRDREAAAVSFLGPTAGVLVAGGYTGGTPTTNASAITLFPSRPVPQAPPVPTPEPTPPLITPTPLPTPTGPVPVQSKQLVAGAITGTVLIKIGTGKYVPLKPGDVIPVGAFLDTTNGHVTLIGAVGAARQSAEFWGGIFQVTQPAAEHGQVDLRIIGTPECPTTKTTKGAKAKASSVVATASAKKKPAKKKKPPPRVWGDGHGDFQTRGANSAATVRGTKWLVEERCEGTFTQVDRGVVSVHDFSRGKTFLLPAPRTYLARPKGK